MGNNVVADDNMSPNHALQWIGGIDGGKLLLTHTNGPLSINNSAEFTKAWSNGLPHGAGSRLAAAAFGIAWHGWELAHQEPTPMSEQITWALAEYAHQLTSLSPCPALPLLGRRLRACCESHEHLLSPAQLAARLFMEARRINEQVQLMNGHCHRYLQQLHREIDITLTPVIDNWWEALWCCAEPQHQASQSGHAIASAAIGLDGVLCDQDSLKILKDQPRRSSLAIMALSWHAVNEPSITNTSLVPWSEISWFIHERGIVSHPTPLIWHTLRDDNTLDWERSLI